MLPNLTKRDSLNFSNRGHILLVARHATLSTSDIVTEFFCVVFNLDFFGRNYHNLAILPNSDGVPGSLMLKQCMLNSAPQNSHYFLTLSDE